MRWPDIKTQQDISHDFFHRMRKAKVGNVSKTETVWVYYHTTMGCIYHSERGGIIYVHNRDNYDSPLTGKVASIFLSACPYQNENIVYLAAPYDSYELDAKTFIHDSYKNTVKKLCDMTVQDMRKARNRREFFDYFESLRLLRSHVSNLPKITKKQEKKLDELRTAWTAKNSEYAKKYGRGINSRLASPRPPAVVRDLTYDTFTSFLKENKVSPYQAVTLMSASNLKTLCSTKYKVLRQAVMVGRTNWFRPKIDRDTSTITWVSDLGIKVEHKELFRLISLFKVGKINVGDVIEGYHVLASMNQNELRVGCHYFSHDYINWLHDSMRDMTPTKLHDEIEKLKEILNTEIIDV